MSTKLRSKVKVQGLGELQKKLGRLPKSMHNPVLGDAVAEAAELVRADAARRAPRGPTGRLQDEMTALRMAGTKDRAASRVGPSANAWYGSFVERGRKGQAAQPFLRPALDSQRRKAINAVKKILKAAVEGEARKR